MTLTQIPETLRLTAACGQATSFLVLVAQDAAGHQEPVISLDVREAAADVS